MPTDEPTDAADARRWAAEDRVIDADIRAGGEARRREDKEELEAGYRLADETRRLVAEALRGVVEEQRVVAAELRAAAAEVRELSAELRRALREVRRQSGEVE